MARVRRAPTLGFRPVGKAMGVPGEMKFVDFTTGDSTISAALRNQNLNVIVQNVLENGRVGRKCTLKAVTIRGSFTLAGAVAASSASCRVRCRLVLDRQTNGSDFAALQLLDTDVIDSFANLSNKDRFAVLMDKVYTLNSSGAAPSGAAFVTMEKTVNIDIHRALDIPIEFDDSVSTGAVASQRSNSLHWVVQTSDGELVAEASRIRVRFKDN